MDYNGLLLLCVFIFKQNFFLSFLPLLAVTEYISFLFLCFMAFYFISFMALKDTNKSDKIEYKFDDELI